MAKKDEVKPLRRRSMFAAMEGLRPGPAFPVSPRKAMSQARKASKRRSYPLAPYPYANPIQLFIWSRNEWNRVGRWQRLAAPFVIIVALLTWEKEQSIRDERVFELEKAQIRREATDLYGSFGERPKRKLLGVIPLPGRKS